VVDTFGAVGEAELRAGLVDQAVRRAFDRVSVRTEPPTDDERYRVDASLTMRWGGKRSTWLSTIPMVTRGDR
jgi:hypothetical protein